MIEPLLLTTTRVATFDGKRPLTGESGFFLERDGRLFLVTSPADFYFSYRCRLPLRRDGSSALVSGDSRRTIPPLLSAPSTLCNAGIASRATCPPARPSGFHSGSRRSARSGIRDATRFSVRGFPAACVAELTALCRCRA